MVRSSEDFKEEGARMIIHKIIKSKYGSPYLCNQAVAPKEFSKSSYQWKNVTCKNCLKQRVVKPKVWIKHLSCGHTRWTGLAALVGNYDKPSIGESAFCRECFRESTVLKVTRGTSYDLKYVQLQREELDKAMDVIKAKKINQGGG
jgi:hypothetical protein